MFDTAWVKLQVIKFLRSSFGFYETKKVAKSAQKALDEMRVAWSLRSLTM